MQTIKFEDKGQDFLSWIIRDGVIVDCQPYQSFVWVGREVTISGRKAFVHKGGDRVPLNYQVTTVNDTDTAYVDGFEDAMCDSKDQKRLEAETQYRFGFNVGTKFKQKSEGQNLG